MKINIINEAINELNNKLSEYDYSMELSSDNKIIYVKDTSRTILNLDMRVYLEGLHSKDELIEIIEYELNDKVNEIRGVSKMVQGTFVSVKDNMDYPYDEIINLFPSYVEDIESHNEEIIELVLVKEDKLKSVYGDYLHYKGDNIISIVSKLNYYRIESNYDFLAESILIITDSIDKISDEELAKVDIITIDSRFSEDIIMNVVSKCKNVIQEFVNVC